MLFWRDSVATCTMHTYWLTEYCFINNNRHIKICSEFILVDWGILGGSSAIQKAQFSGLSRSNQHQPAMKLWGPPEVGERVLGVLSECLVFFQSRLSTERKGSLQISWLYHSIALSKSASKQCLVKQKLIWNQWISCECKLIHATYQLWLPFEFFSISDWALDQVIKCCGSWLLGFHRSNHATCQRSFYVHESRRTYLRRIWDDLGLGSSFQTFQTFIPHFGSFLKNFDTRCHGGPCHVLRSSQIHGSNNHDHRCSNLEGQTATRRTWMNLVVLLCFAPKTPL